MKLDLPTVAFILGLVYLTQAVAIYVQHRVNRTGPGISYWLAGSSLMACGCLFLLLTTVAPVRYLGMLGNPMLVLGNVFQYVGVRTFFGRNAERRLLAAYYAVFVVSYFASFGAVNGISGRTIIVSLAVAGVTLATAARLYFSGDATVAGSSRFTATVFLLFGLFLLVLSALTAMAPPLRTYADMGPIHTLAYLVSILASTLWTFGLILMVNQRLHAENEAKQETMRLAQEALRESEETYRSILHASPDDITITDLQGRLVMVSPAAKKMFGYEEGYAGFDNMNLMQFVDPADVERAGANIARMLRDDYPGPNTYRARRRDGSVFDVEVNSGYVRGRDGRPTRMVFVVRDISERRAAEQRIQELIRQLEIERNTAQLNSVTDSLTGLSNRRHFDEVLRTEFLRAKRSRMPLSLILLDVDHFKKFNDTYGHVAGDICLQRIGAVLRSVVSRAADTVARYGGEEFVAVLPETDRDGVVAIAERIRRTIEDLAIPNEGSDASAHVTVSEGAITVIATAIESPELIVQRADQALYAAKQNGRNRAEFAGDPATEPPEGDCRVVPGRPGSTLT